MAIPLQVVLVKATGRRMVEWEDFRRLQPPRTVPQASPPAGSTRGAAASS
jgi:hypothetical protein